MEHLLIHRTQVEEMFLLLKVLLFNYLLFFLPCCCCCCCCELTKHSIEPFRFG